MAESLKTVLLSRGICRTIGEIGQGVGKGKGTQGNIGIHLGINRKEEKIVQDLVADLATATPQEVATKPVMSKSSTAIMGKGLISSLKAILATLMTLTQEGMTASFTN
jgi:hypothetical protein